jgi:hypothetical protein
MGAPSPWATAVAPIGSVAVGSLLWFLGERPHLTVIVKARFAFRHEAPMLAAGSPMLVELDLHQDDDPTRSLRDASDLVPYRPRADVWVVGHAYAPRGRAVGVSVARLGVYRGQQVLLEKSVHVVGDREGPGAPPRPFERVPLTYERAYGGPGFDDNPVGVGADDRPLQPNVVDAVTPGRPTGLGPVSRYWKARRRYVSTDDRRRLDQPTPRVPDALDWAYFQAAPEDQRIPYLRGDEWVVLDGMHPTLLRVQSRLPKVAGVARVLPLGPGGEDFGDAVAMVADTLAIDADGQVCSVTWRGSFPLAAVADIGRMLIAGAVVGAGESVDWDVAYRTRRSRPPPIALGSPQLDRTGPTLVMAAPVGVVDELSLDDPLAKTTVDPPRVPSAPTLPSAGVTGRHYRRRPAPEAMEAADSSDRGGDGEATMPHRRDALDTEPGEVPTVSEDELPWVKEAAVEPEARSARVSSMPPRPFDAKAYQAALREAGASERDIEALLGKPKSSR